MRSSEQCARDEARCEADSIGHDRRSVRERSLEGRGARRAQDDVECRENLRGAHERVHFERWQTVRRTGRANEGKRLGVQTRGEHHSCLELPMPPRKSNPCLNHAGQKPRYLVGSTPGEDSESRRRLGNR